MKIIAAAVLFLSFLPAALPAQDQLPVDVGNPVYRAIELCVIRGIIHDVSAVKPYTRREVREYVREAMESGGSLSPEELSILEAALEELAENTAAADLRVGVKSTFRAGFPEAAINSVNMAELDVVGGLGTSLSYDVNLGVFFDKVDPAAYPPFDFTKEWDGFHIWADEAGPVVSSGTTSPGIAWRSLPILSLDLLDSRINVQFSRMRREWGVGEGSLSLSATARPILAVTGDIHLFPWANASFLVGSLGNWWDPIHDSSMLSIHRLEVFPLGWLYLSAWESVVWAKRMELTYLDPIMPYVIGQQIIGDLDNLSMGGDVAVTLSPYGRLYFSVFIDEISLVPLDQLFTQAKNQFAWQAGAKIPVPWIPHLSWTLLSVQYTKIEPYTYTHYPQTLPQYTSPVDIGYTNDGENIGYHLPPNSDELLVRLSTDLGAWQIAAQYQLIRHGTGSRLLGQIEGDINAPYIYDSSVTYPPKSFLHDGIYETLNILKLRVSWTIAVLRTAAWAEYAFVSAVNFNTTAGDDRLMSFLGIGLRVSID